MSIDFRALQEKLRERILAEIAAGELTGLELARLTGFQQAHISNFLNRKRGLSLEAMDAILRARKLSLEDLMRPTKTFGGSARSLHANSPGVTFIPLVDGENCYATEVPYSASQNALAVMSSGLEKLPERMQTPRPHWQRFVGMRVAAEDGRAMGPRLARGAVVVVDRHSNEADGKSIYLARHGKKLVLRYVEAVEGRLVLRAENREFPLLFAEDGAAIVGRVCGVMERM